MGVNVDNGYFILSIEYSWKYYELVLLKLPKEIVQVIGPFQSHISNEGRRLLTVQVKLKDQNLFLTRVWREKNHRVVIDLRHLIIVLCSLVWNFIVDSLFENRFVKRFDRKIGQSEFIRLIVILALPQSCFYA